MVDTRSILVAGRKFCKVTFCSYIGQPEKKYYLLKNVPFDLIRQILKHEVDIYYPNFKTRHFLQLHGLLNHGVQYIIPTTSTVMLQRIRTKEERDVTEIGYLFIRKWLWKNNTLLNNIYLHGTCSNSDYAKLAPFFFGRMFHDFLRRSGRLGLKKIIIPTVWKKYVGILRVKLL